MPERKGRVVEGEPAAPERRDELGGAVGGLDLDRGVDVVVGELGCRPLRELCI